MKLEFNRLYDQKLFYPMHLTDVPMYGLFISERLAKFICNHHNKWHVKFLKLDWNFYINDKLFYPYAISLKSNVVLMCYTYVSKTSRYVLRDYFIKITEK